MFYGVYYRNNLYSYDKLDRLLFDHFVFRPTGSSWTYQNSSGKNHFGSRYSYDGFVETSPTTNTSKKMNNNAIHILPFDINKDEINHYYPCEWLLENLNSEFVILLTDDDFDQLHRSQIISIVNEENDSMIGCYEDDVLFENSIKESILGRIRNIKPKLAIDKHIHAPLIRLLEIAIANNRNVYFQF